MKRREALQAAADLTAEVFRVIRARVYSSWSHCLYVEVDGLPCASLTWVASGPSRAEEQIDLMVQIVGVANEAEPLFWDPYGQGEPVLTSPPLHRIGSDYTWAQPREQLPRMLDDAVRQRWNEWRGTAMDVFARNPAAWAEACVRVASMPEPLRWLAERGFDPRAPELEAIGLPIEQPWEAKHWTRAWLGLAPILDGVVHVSKEHLARIRGAAEMVRSSSTEPTTKLVQ